MQAETEYLVRNQTIRCGSLKAGIHKPSHQAPYNKKEKKRNAKISMRTWSRMSEQQTGYQRGRGP
jgi:hypothetical protein